MKKENVPDSFPGTVALVDNKVNDTLLHPSYRTSCDDENFTYLVTRLLPKVTAAKTSGYNSWKAELLVSEIFTVTDEAFVLFVLYNKFDIWEKQKVDIANGKKGRQLVREKKFCSGASGKKQAWSERGLNCFYKLVGEVHQRREETKNVEEEMRANMAANKKGASTTSTKNQNKNNNSSEKEWWTADIESRLKIDKLMQISRC